MVAASMQLKSRIAAEARALGFDAVGFTTAAPPPHAAAFQRWLAAGYHGEMQYMSRRTAARCDPQRLLRGARTIICVGQNFAPVASAPAADTKTVRGRIARYAQGDADYHHVMGRRLEKLAELLRQLGGEAKWYVDTGPVLERDLAQRAGIGFVGKHTNLISLQWGNWLMLGEVLTTLELPADSPHRELCGRCTRCLQVCPTGALVAAYRLDARRCISYLTIELKGSIPEQLRPLIGDRVFGCDDCLEVCPWNRFARPVIVPRPWPALSEMLGWNEAQLTDFCRGTPLERLGRARLLRNLCVAAGNVGDRSVQAALERLCQDADPLVREHAVWARRRLEAAARG